MNLEHLQGGFFSINMNKCQFLFTKGKKYKLQSINYIARQRMTPFGVHCPHSYIASGGGKGLTCNQICERRGIKMYNSNPGWCGSVDCVLACETRYCQFGSQSGHMPGLQARSPVGGVQDAATH